MSVHKDNKEKLDNVGCGMCLQMDTSNLTITIRT